MTRFATRKPLPRLMAALLLAAVAVPWPALPEEESVEKKWAERDGWQRPAEVMDALGVKPGSVVADVGCGDGSFTFYLASRGGPGVLDVALDAALIVDAYHEMEKFDAMLAAIYRALKPGGVLGIIDRKTEP